MVKIKYLQALGRDGWKVGPGFAVKVIVEVVIARSGSREE